MATSCSDDSCGAPKSFNLSSVEGSESRFSTAHHKCQLCLHLRKLFYCRRCIRSGDFVHSTSHFSERFSEKQLRLMRIKRNCNFIEGRCEALLLSRLRQEDARLRLAQSQEKVRLLRLAIEEKCEASRNNAARLRRLKDYNEQVQAKLPLDREKVDNMRRFVRAQAAAAEERGDFLTLQQEALRRLRTDRLRQLLDYVFTVREIDNSQSCGYGGAECTERALAEACRPAEGAPGPAPLQLLTAGLPLDGDYSAYCHWVAANKGPTISASSPAVADPVKQNPAYRISAALAYSAQLVNLAAFFLDARLPFSVSYMDLCGSELDERRFRRRVWRLQGCAAAILALAEPHRALREPPLHALLRACPLQLPSTPVVEASCFVEPEEEEAWGGAPRSVWWGGDSEGNMLGASDDDEPEPPEHLHWEWEAVGDQVQARAPSGQNSSPANTGLMTSAAASIVSMWRGWTAK